MKHFFVSISMTASKPLCSILGYIISYVGFLFFNNCAPPARTKTVSHLGTWDQLTNPVLELTDGQITGVDAVYEQGTWYVFYSATYEDSTREYSQIVEVSTKDFKEFSGPILAFTGQEDGWTGMANPAITRLRNIYYLTFNSWDHTSGKPGQLFYMTSRDLKTWTAKTPLASNLTANEKTTHPALAFSRGKWFLLYNQDKETRIAITRGVRTPFEKLGLSTLSFYSTTDTIVAHSRHQPIRFGNKWGLLASGNNYTPYLYRLSTQGTTGLGWLTWEGGYPIKVFRREIGTVRAPQCAAMVNMQRLGGYFYLFYVINSGDETSQQTGSSKVEIYRSADLMYWAPAGK